MPKAEIHVKKIMYAIFFRSTGIVAIVKKEKKEKGNSDWYVNKCLSKVFADIREKRPKSGLKRIILHHDNCRPHKAAITTKFLEDNGVELLPHPPYSPDLSPCDFWLFKNLKQCLRGTRFNTEAEIDSAVNAFFESIKPEEWRAVYKSWVDRMRRVIQVKGDYI
jgi:[histone H3]-lysine36 N-dimethyltransferase SETMAR